MSEERRTIKGWAARLSAPDEQLTLEEARTLATIAQADRLLEIRDTLQDIQARMTRIELWMAKTVPGYDQETRSMAQALVNGKTEG